MNRTGRAPRAWRRFLLVGAGLATLVAAPSLVAALPADDDPVSAERLWRRVLDSHPTRYSGYAEATSRLALPDVPAVGDVLELLGETTALRVWYRDEDRWRVDELTQVGERDTIHFPGGSWEWDSVEREATRLEGDPAVRLIRAADLTPPELGRRLAAAAQPEELTRLGARRVAGGSALGLRITPADAETTVRTVDIWAHPRTGLPLEVQVRVRDGGDQPLLETRFLDLSLGDVSDRVLAFTPPPGADIDVTTSGDIAAAINQFSIFAVPDVVAGRPRRTQLASGAGTYGEGFELVAVLTLEERNYHRARRRVSETVAPTEDEAFGEGFVITTPLLNGMLVLTPQGVAYALAGTVPPDVLRRMATDLASRDVRLRDAGARS